MGYVDAPGEILRLGDIVEGFVSVSPRIDKPPVHEFLQEEIPLEFRKPSRLVVMSPCCSIADRMILLAPLERIQRTVFNAPRLREDPELMNRPILWSDAAPTKQLEAMNEDDIAAKDAEGPGFVHNAIFVYSPHDLLGEYPVKDGETTLTVGHFAVEFRRIFSVASTAIVRNRPLTSVKLLELDVPTRHELRQKLAHFFARVPEEDKDPLEAAGISIDPWMH